MNIFKSLIGKVWHDPNAAEVVKISSGQLYLLRPGNIRTSRECIYHEAMATIRRVPTLEHNFQLVITKVYEEGDEELLEDEDETDEERVFLVSDELEFRTGVTDDEPAFLWRDLDGDIDEFYEFVSPETNEPTRAFFETCMYRAMYERKYRKSADNTTDAELEQFIWRPPPKKDTSAMKKRSSKKNSANADQLASDMQALKVSEPTVASTSSPPASPPKSKLKTKSTPIANIMISDEAELYFWNAGEEQFENQGVVHAYISKESPDSYQYLLTAVDQEGILILQHTISEDMNQRFNAKLQSITWNHLEDDYKHTSWLFRFIEPQSHAAFIAVFTKAIWELKHSMNYDKNKPEEQRYIVSSNMEDVEMADVENEEDDDEDEVAQELDPEEEKESDSEGDEEYDEDPSDLPPALAKGDKNSQLIVGYKGDRSYVVRGNNIGVFRHDAGSQVKYYATMGNISTPKGSSFKPSHVMLHDQDSKMILMDPTSSHSVFNLDIERGKVVEEWKVHDDVEIKNIAPDNKFAPTTREQTFVGTSGNALFRVDPRVSGTKMVESQFKQYVSKNKFSGVTTTADGKLAVASEKGDIRLFDSIGKNAKTALPPLGDPIIGIDVTKDGRWIVATTKSYLLLIDTLIGEGRYAGSFGFDRSFPATSKPIPRRLQLRPDHVAYMEHRIAFTPARFNQGENQDENAIVTSTGPYVVAWDFAKVKKGQLDKYEIKKYEDHVVQDNFKFGDDKEIIIALDNNVIGVNKKALKKATRQSLAPNIRNTRSNIVQEY